MRNFFDEQGRTRVFARGVRLYVEGGNPRRTPLIGKITIYGWKRIRLPVSFCTSVNKGLGNHLYMPPFIDPDILAALTLYLIISLHRHITFGDSAFVAS
jgi:hypothetical protein